MKLKFFNTYSVKSNIYSIKLIILMENQADA